MDREEWRQEEKGKNEELASQLAAEEAKARLFNDNFLGEENTISYIHSSLPILEKQQIGVSSHWALIFPLKSHMGTKWEDRGVDKKGRGYLSSTFTITLKAGLVKIDFLESFLLKDFCHLLLS